MVEVPDYPARTEAQRDALDEAEQVAEWAAPTDPEWVRAIGALSEVYEGTAHGPKLQQQYAGLLDALARHRPDPYDEFDVVIRQLRERDYHRAAFVAAKAGADAHPTSSWLCSVCANCASRLGDEPTALRYILRAAEQLEEEEHADALRAWQAVVQRATTVGDAAILGRARQRVAALEGQP